ncbi:MAG: hypothetical protein QOG87_2780 [Actinomycetota bacterium]|jgi:hypothetical protein
MARSSKWLLGSLLAAVLAASGLSLQAHAQTAPPCDPGPPDPYSGGLPPCEDLRQTTISLSLTFGPPGTLFQVKAEGFEPGSPVDITFGGEVVRTTVAQPKGSSGTALGARGGALAVAAPIRLLAMLGARTHLVAQADPTVGAIDETVAVPDVSPGTYDVCVVSPGSETACGAFRVTPKTSVLGVSFTRGGSGGGGASVSVLGRTFSRTGLAILPWVALGVILIVGGRYLVVRSRTRNQRA